AIFLYLNRVDAETMLYAARSVTIFWSLCLGLILAVWTRRRFGASVALLAIFLYAFDPNIIAQGRYVTNDLLIAGCLFLAPIAWSAFLSTGRLRDLLRASAALALAAVVKFSGLLLFPVFVVLYLIKWWQEGKHSLRNLALSLAVAGGVTVAVIGLCYS